MPSFFETEFDPRGFSWLWLNRPSRRNFLSWDFWEELPGVIAGLEADARTHAIVVAARGQSFSMGLDLEDFITRFPFLAEGNDAATRDGIYNLIVMMQNAINSVADCKIPVIAAIQRHCIGGALDLVSAADIRIASADAIISLREAKVSIVADMGSLQRLPGAIPDGLLREMAFTGNDIPAARALAAGFINSVYENREELHKAAGDLATEIAANDSFTVRGVKAVLNRSRDMTLDQRLEYVLLYNAAFIQNASFLSMVKQLKDRKSAKSGG